MRAEELMINDWVQTKEVHTPDYYQPSYKRRVAQINDFGVELFFLDRYGNKCYGSKKFDHIEPIPLTAEILDKNGFDVSDGEVMRYNFEEDGQSFHFGLRQMYDKENKPKGYSFYAFNVLTIIDFVHELQHALRLCGIEKEIVL